MKEKVIGKTDSDDIESMEDESIDSNLTDSGPHHASYYETKITQQVLVGKTQKALQTVANKNIHFKNGQLFLIRILQSLFPRFYKFSEGMCYGETHAALNAFLLGHQGFFQYNTRIKLFNKLVLRSYQEAINYYDTIVKPFSIKEFAREFRTKVRERIRHNFYKTIPQTMQQECLAVLQNIVVIQANQPDFEGFKGMEHINEFSIIQNMDSQVAKEKLFLNNLLMSNALARKGGYEIVKSTIRHYTKSELNACFNHYKSLLIKNNIDFPVAFTLEANEHIVFIGYQPKLKAFYFHDINELLKDSEIEVPDLSEWVSEAFHFSKPTKFPLSIGLRILVPSFTQTLTKKNSALSNGRRLEAILNKQPIPYGLQDKIANFYQAKSQKIIKPNPHYFVILFVAILLICKVFETLVGVESNKACDILGVFFLSLFAHAYADVGTMILFVTTENQVPRIGPLFFDEKELEKEEESAKSSKNPRSLPKKG
ncbi:hypothetical protein [Legionella sp. W05-934-2]|uniref:hypothetical protein n=1 Tax=Legionella sp. W05-934-2 TaxID=1198649 RepID=UPI0034635F3A